VILITAGDIFSLDQETRQVSLVKKRGQWSYSGGNIDCPGYGVVRCGTGWITSSRRNPAEPGTQVFIFLDDQFEITEIVTPPFMLRNIHQMVVRSGEVWIVSAKDKCIGIYNIAQQTWRNIVIDESSENKLPNTIYIKSDSEFFVMCHNMGPSEIWRFQDGVHTDTYSAGTKSHDIWEMDGDMWFCDSKNAKIKSFGGDSVDLDGDFARGVCVTEDFIYVGMSFDYKRVDPPGTLPSINVIDRVTMSVVDKIAIPGALYVCEFSLY
jgi:hypothetical protein